MRTACRPILLAVFGLLLPLSSWGRLPTGLPSDPLPAPQGAVTVVQPDRGYIDEAMALSDDGSVLFFVHTDGASWATLRAVGLPRSGTQITQEPPAPAAVPAPAPAPAGKVGPGPARAPVPAPAVSPVAPAFTLEAGKTVDLITGLSLSIIRMHLLPNDQVLFVMRDLESSGIAGTVYSLRTHAALNLPGVTGGSIGPVTDIAVGQSAQGPVIVSMNRPGGQGSASEARGDYQVQMWSGSTLKPLGQRTYKVREADGRVQTEKGAAAPLYFIDDFQTLVAKHDGFFDKKKDSRQPDFLAFLEVLTGKLRRSQNITDPNGLLELVRFHKEHSESVFPLADAETQKIYLFAVNDRAPADASAESRLELQLPRPSNQYEGSSLRYQRLRRDRLMFSLTVDPVNEQAVAARRSDPDDIDIFLAQPFAAPAQAASPRRLRTLPGYRRPTVWTASLNGRFALLRKHKNFPRGGTQVEVYDLDLEGTTSTNP
jgi:hypothetical protein